MREVFVYIVCFERYLLNGDLCINLAYSSEDPYPSRRGEVLNWSYKESNTQTIDKNKKSCGWTTQFTNIIFYF